MLSVGRSVIRKRMPLYSISEGAGRMLLFLILLMSVGAGREGQSAARGPLTPLSLSLSRSLTARRRSLARLDDRGVAAATRLTPCGRWRRALPPDRAPGHRSRPAHTAPAPAATPGRLYLCWARQNSLLPFSSSIRLKPRPLWCCNTQTQGKRRQHPETYVTYQHVSHTNTRHEPT